MKKIIDYVISIEEDLHDKFFVMQIYENRQWDTYETFHNAEDAINCVIAMNRTLKEY